MVSTLIILSNSWIWSDCIKRNIHDLTLSLYFVSLHMINFVESDESKYKHESYRVTDFDRTGGKLLHSTRLVTVGHCVRDTWTTRDVRVMGASLSIGDPQRDGSYPD